MKKTLISILLLACLALGLCSCAGGDKMKHGIQEFGDGAKDALDDMLAYDTTSHGITISLCSAEIPLADHSEALATKQLVATVNETYVTSALVDWSIYWIINPYESDASVTDYVNVIPASDGSLTANVECYQAFSRDAVIGVRCTTREGGYWAECKVTFVGHPTSMYFSLEGSKVTSAPVLTPWTEYAFDLVLVNPFSDANPDYKPSYTLVNYGVAGRVQVKKGIYVAGSAEYSQPAYEDYASIFHNQVLGNVEIKDSQLVFSTRSCIEEAHITSITENYRIKYVSGSENVHYYATVKDTVSGLTQTLYFYIRPSNSSVINVNPSVSF